ncbi:hypothetical protein [Mycetocola zhadangensis]|uniref:Uncharacterized protein n=1 Tax=Mycetocola zhadangensis TaxID=1164595 RepID=A0A3L7ISW9_9MICO|nr:hypothetical protein [Mycetocola zhadangensis]RLQ81263.1 hypothetical protein D9V28_12870 [Mycetocola zhadangensis]GGF03263.1 hypothetical protein GCM10011313_28000 [Mycetocola zhadangensis]
MSLPGSRRPWLPVSFAVVTLLLLGGCASVPTAAWRVAPIEYDNGVDGREDRIDVTYPMANITSDTAGGLWTESAGSWLHLDENGNTLRRFNADMFMTVHGISAVSPTMLAVSRTDREDVTGSSSGLFLFDTDAGTWDAVDVDSRTTGDVAVDGTGRIVFVDFVGATAPDARGSDGVTTPTPFAIRTVDTGGSQTTIVDVTEGLSATDVAVDIDSAGTTYVSTDRETYSIRTDGTRALLGRHSTRRPVLAVSASGDVLASSSGSANTDVQWAMTRGSFAARAVMTDYGNCTKTGEVGLVLREGRKATPLPFTCGVAGAAWIDESTFVVSIGSEGGAILSTVTPPQDKEDRPDVR